MEADPFDELDFFGALAKSGVRVVLIGRRALIAIGLPVLTADYDLWIEADGAERLNSAVAHLDLVPNRSPEEARKVGRYVLENGERVDVLLAKQVSTTDGVPVRFDDVHARARILTLSNGATLRVPTVEDLILTKRFGSRAKDIADIRLLETLAAKERGT